MIIIVLLRYSLSSILSLFKLITMTLYTLPVFFVCLFFSLFFCIISYAYTLGPNLCWQISPRPIFFCVYRLIYKNVDYAVYEYSTNISCFFGVLPNPRYANRPLNRYYNIYICIFICTYSYFFITYNNNH